MQCIARWKLHSIYLHKLKHIGGINIVQKKQNYILLPIVPFLWKLQPRVLLSVCLMFSQSQPGVAYKSVAYKKKACISFEMFLDPTRLFGSQE